MINISLDYETQLEMTRIFTLTLYILTTATFIFLPMVEILIIALLFGIVNLSTSDRLHSFREHKAIHEYQQTILKTLKKHIKKGRV